MFFPAVAAAEKVAKEFGIRLHPFTRWQMGRYAKLRNLKYLAYPFFLERLVVAAAREIKFDLVFSQHAISAVAAELLFQLAGGDGEMACCEKDQVKFYFTRGGDHQAVREKMDRRDILNCGASHSGPSASG